MKDYKAKIKINKEIAKGIYLLTLTLDDDIEGVRGGTFMNLSVGDGEKLLRRPFGILKTEGRDVTVCYQQKGEGTKSLATKKVGETLSVLLPLGNGFDLKRYHKVAVIGGGVGIFPLISAIRENSDKEFYTYFGFRNKDAVCLLNELDHLKKSVVVTDDGSFGKKGNAVQAYFDDMPDTDAIIACGPPVMLKALKAELISRGIKTPCFVSLEERMGCGIGACLVCVCKTEKGDMKRVCKDGPVFDIAEVSL